MSPVNSSSTSVAAIRAAKMGNGIAHVTAVNGIDTAMHPGTHYPRRPLACGADLNAAFATSVLEMLQAHYADTCCRVAPFLRCLSIDGERFHD